MRKTTRNAILKKIASDLSEEYRILVVSPENIIENNATKSNGHEISEQKPFLLIRPWFPEEEKGNADES